MSHIADFGRAASDLRRQLDRGVTPPEYIRHVEFCEQAIRLGQRFVFQDGAGVMSGRTITADLHPIMRLPYPVTVVWCGESRDGEYKRIVVAQQRGEEIDILPVVRTRKRGEWVIFPAAAIIEFDDGVDGFQTRLLLGPGAEAVGHNELAEDVLTVVNLCAMLGMHNVSTSSRRVPPAVNRKRIRNGKTPLYDYHVLVVDGEHWSAVGDETGRTIRSHMRRGHIRRLADRCVWVRSTLVKGGASGFSDKEYSLRN